MSDEPQPPAEETPGSPFARLRHEPRTAEVLVARDLARVLGYARWDKFRNAIQRAETACANSGQDVDDHFSHVGNMITIGKGGRREIDGRPPLPLRLLPHRAERRPQQGRSSRWARPTSRFKPADRRKPTRLAGPHRGAKAALPARPAIDHNRNWPRPPTWPVWCRAIDFAIFQDHGYMGLYGGLRARDIHERKG